MLLYIGYHSIPKLNTTHKVTIVRMLFGVGSFAGICLRILGSHREFCTRSGYPLKGLYGGLYLDNGQKPLSYYLGFRDFCAKTPKLLFRI